jgi:hypothetical protein
MSWYSRTIFMTLGMVMWWSVSALGSVDCGPCEEPNDPSLVMGGGSPCAPLDEGAGIEGEPCKECDGKGGIRNKERAEEMEVDGVPGRCCGGVWYAIDQAKEESECWEWDDMNCEYLCSDVPGPVINAEDVQTVELECPWSTEPLPTLFATATDHCGNAVKVVQSPAGGG